MTHPPARARICKLNEAADEVAAIINDPQTQRVIVVPNITVVNFENGSSEVIGSITDGFTPGATQMSGGVMTSYVLDRSTKPGKLPGPYWSNGVAQSVTFGEVTGHEIAHGRARLTKDRTVPGQLCGWKIRCEQW
jgi:hypothetical protein